MQKKLIALAVAGLVAAPAFAQSNVTIYGIADVYLYSTYGDGVRATGLDAGGAAGSRLGFKGTEDLGNGLKGVFVYEYGTLAVDSNANGLNGTRQSYVGLSGNFGTVVGGRLQTPGYYASADYDVTGAAFYSPVQNLQKYIGSTIIAGNSARLDNAVAYLTPTWGGFSGVLAYSFNEEIKDGDRGSVIGLGAKYANGPLSVNYVYHGLNDVSGADLNVDEHFIGGSYDFGSFALLGSFQARDVDGGDNDKVFNIGGSVKIGAAGKLVVQYAAASMDADDRDASGLGVGYFHSLSKRTTLYAGLGRVANDDAGTAGLQKVTPVNGDKNVTTFGLGVNHKF